MAGSSPVVITVSRIRQEFQRASGGLNAAADGRPSNALLGRIFHESFAALMSHESQESWRRTLLPADLDEPAKLREHVYARLVGPRLAHYSGALQASGWEVLDFWNSVCQMCDWTRAMLATARSKGLIEYDEAAESWRVSDALVHTEQEVSWQLHLPDWDRPVRVVGIADAVWRKPESGDFCVVEYKIGRTSPEADLCQACLYHEMLASNGGSSGSLAMLRFLPELNEAFYGPDALARARGPLVDLIGSVAGVLNNGHRPPEPIPATSISPEHEALGRALLRVLSEFGSPAKIEGNPIVGPTFIRYVLEPEKRIKTGGILKQALDLQVRLRLDAAPIIHVDRGLLVVDLQRKDRQTVFFSSIQDQLPAGGLGSPLVPIGVDLAGKLHFADLSSSVNAHILVAGTSGSGKSEWMRSALAGLLLANTPETLRLVLIDPKRNAFTDLKGSPFLYRPDAIVYPPENSAVDALGMLIEEMETRYRDFEKSEADDLEQYIRKSGDLKPRVVCVCDEYADLISADKTIRKEIETAIARLGAKARAAGIHLMIATQRPSRDIVAGALKANMSCKVALKTQSSIESRLILEEAGAENLLGNGDLLFADIGKPIRLQSPYLTETERAEIFRR